MLLFSVTVACFWGKVHEKHQKATSFWFPLKLHHGLRPRTRRKNIGFRLVEARFTSSQWTWSPPSLGPASRKCSNASGAPWRFFGNPSAGGLVVGGGGFPKAPQPEANPRLPENCKELLSTTHPNFHTCGKTFFPSVRCARQLERGLPVTHFPSSVSDFSHSMGLDRFSRKQTVQIFCWPIHSIGSELRGTLD